MLDGEWDGVVRQHGAYDVVKHIQFSIQPLEMGWDPRTYNIILEKNHSAL